MERATDESSPSLPLRSVIRIGVTLVLSLVTAGVSAEMAYSTPEAEGVSSKAVSAWIDACERGLDAVHGFVIVRHGKTIAEGWWKPYAAFRTHTLYSQSKSFVSAAVGLLVDDGKLDLDERVADIFPEKLPKSSSPRLRALRVRDLLTMNAGMVFAENGMRDPAGDWLANCLATPVKHDPGTHFQYDSGATYILAALVERKGGERVMDLLNRRLFKPIGIERAWSTTSPQGIVCGGWGMNMTTREVARFGQLLLQEGRWDGRQVLSRDWVRLATSRQTASRRGSADDLRQGYGFQFWRCRHNGYLAYGAYGQFLIVLPDQDAVISIHAGLDPIEKELDLVWKHLLPAMKTGPLPEDQAACAALRMRCANLALKTVRGVSMAPPDVFGKTYDLALKHRFGFRTVRLEERPGGWEVVFTRAKGREVRIPVGYGTWREGRSVFEDGTCELLGSVIGEQPTAASGAWEGRTFRMRAYLHDTFFRLDGVFTFGENGTLNLALNLWGVWRNGSARGTGRAQKISL